MCLQTKVLASLQVIRNFFFFFFTFPKTWVGRAMGNETFYGDGLSEKENSGEIGFYSVRVIIESRLY